MFKDLIYAIKKFFKGPFSFSYAFNKISSKSFRYSTPLEYSSESLSKISSAFDFRHLLIIFFALFGNSNYFL